MHSVFVWQMVADKEAIFIVRLLLDIGPPLFCQLSLLAVGHSI